MSALAPERTLIDDLLADQQRLVTPVAEFADRHDREPDLAGHYRRLIPLSKPDAGEQYAFEVALDKCTSCKACVAACHSQNGLDEEESWRDVGLLLGGEEKPGWQQTITSACHHCGDPECLNGCPVQAYEKSPENGIVRHLDDQCIGCSYCIFKCPFDVPKFSKKRGIVRKCDMCHDRLAEGEAPACVQACPTEAIRIVKVERKEKDKLGQRGLGFLPGAPSPQITLPTTRYTGREVPTTAVAADEDNLTPEHAHWPLVLMLVFTQAAVGLFLGSRSGGVPPASIPLLSTVLSLGLFSTGLIAATLHLGQPLKAWRFFLGLRTSWLSRELLAFTILGGFLTAPLLNHLPFALPAFLAFLPGLINHPAFFALSAVTALGAVFTSAKIYETTPRTLWQAEFTFPRFFGTVALFAAWSATSLSPVATGLTLLILAGKVTLDGLQLRQDKLSRERRLITGPLRPLALFRLATAGLGALALLLSPSLAFPLLLLSELAERALYFKAVRPLKMPGFLPA
ncbi:DmsC/YnfH family molybdoenzyme membrane anchor subunit [Roseibacillus ishigakijimensis]|uniref:Dimethyl sulfoxide reductase anchor subunit n=1 Tax=Roseibacillus ishigakijimensis TaxID=454146 RepID=A0A934VK66_9BACT|nr:DmsC/YnfH family molybdoenzyme membrane anchor subunit [Roseibacillus ishigakijimensis]MBK1833329.1 dimethyl sulfoxide reductase anchor subunit [Roseibacillus ishigakijimensis]